MHRISKLLIANRGEIASRIIRTTKRLGVQSIAVYNEADMMSNYVQEASQSIFVPGEGNVFVDMQKLISIAKANKADAIHPGYGFLSENSAFSRLCKENGIKFVGPSFDAMQLLSSKSDAKRIAISKGIPVVPGYNGSDQTISTLIKEIHKIGYPVLLKASLGGGGRGMRVVNGDNNLEKTIELCQSEAQHHFGSSMLLLEKYLPETQHIEIQVFGDQYGSVIHLGERECSLQRNYQKIVEEAPCFYLSLSEKQQLYRWAVEIAKASHYEGAGTVEFLSRVNEQKEREFFFMEVNTRLQVEHLITERINHDIDLVALQLRIAQGESLKDMGVESYEPSSRYAMECRVYNEDPKHGFLPGEGTLHYQNGIVNSGIQVENNMTPSQQGVSFDPMLLKIVASEESREKTIQSMLDALRHTHIYGIPTNLQFLSNALQHPQFQQHGATSRFIQDYANDLMKTIPVSSLEACNSIASVFFSSVSTMPLQGFSNTAPLTTLGSISINRETKEYRVVSHEKNRITIELKSEGTWSCPVDACLVSKEESRYHIQLNNQLVKNSVYVEPNGTHHIFPTQNNSLFPNLEYIAKLCHKRLTSSSTTMKTGLNDVICPLPSRLSRILVKNGDRVKKGDVLLVIEAMKMEHMITAPQDGVVEMKAITEKQFLKKDQKVMRIL